MDTLLPPEHFEPHRRRLTELARGWLGNQAEAEDAVQDAYLRAGGSAVETRDSMEAWLVTVLRNLCMDRLRRRRVEQRVAMDMPTPAHAVSAEHTAILSLDAAAVLRQIARRLRPEEAASLLLYTVFDFDHADLSRLGGHGEAASRQRLHRAMQRLRDATREDKVDREDAELRLGMYQRAMQMRNPASLMALLGKPVVSAVAPASIASHGDAPRSKATLVHSGGHYAMSIELDGVVLCVMPLGLVDELS